MSESDGTRALARRLVNLERRLAATERSTRLQYATVGIATSTEVDAPVVDLDVSGALFSGVEAGADAMSALDKASRAARTFTQADPPTPASQVDGVIPEGSLWKDTDDGNREYRWTGGVWVQQAVGQGALDAQLLALVLMRFATVAQRDQLIPAPTAGMRAYVVATNLDYQYAGGVWVPLLQYVKKDAAQSFTGTTFVTDAHIGIDMVPGSYRVEPFLHASGDSASNMKIMWDFLGGTYTGGARSALGMAVGDSDPSTARMRTASTSLTDPAWYGTTLDAISVIREDIYLAVVTPGRLRLRVAQYAASGGAVTLSAATRVYITKVA